MTQEANKWQALVGELRTENGEIGQQDGATFDSGYAYGLHKTADRIEALMAEICDVALEGCEPEDFERLEPCLKHATMDSFEEGFRWGRFTKKETG